MTAKEKKKKKDSLLGFGGIFSPNSENSSVSLILTNLLDKIIYLAAHHSQAK